MYANKLQAVAIIKVNITRANDKIHPHSNYFNRIIKHITLLPHTLWYIICKELFCTNNIHTYIIGHYNPSVRLYRLASHITHVVLILYMSGGTYRLMTTDFWETFSWQIYFLLSEFLPEICWEEGAEEIFSYFPFDAWSGILTQDLCLISQYTSF